MFCLSTKREILVMIRIYTYRCKYHHLSLSKNYRGFNTCMAYLFNNVKHRKQGQVDPKDIQVSLNRTIHINCVEFRALSHEDTRSI